MANLATRARFLNSQAPTPEAADALAAVRKHIANARSYRFWGGVPNGSQLAAQYEYHPGTSRPLR